MRFSDRSYGLYFQSSSRGLMLLALGLQPKVDVSGVEKFLNTYNRV